jgi:putative glutamine amidotransferase
LEQAKAQADISSEADGTKVKIAISVSKREQDKGEQSPYFRALVAAGAKPDELELVGPGDSAHLRSEEVDGMLLTGGSDVDPALYGEVVKQDYNVKVDRERDQFELACLDRALQLRLPVLGLCRGAQVVNVKFDGTLYQDLERDWAPETEDVPALHHKQSEARCETTHAVTITDPESRLAEVFEGSCRVNSMHHQGIRALGRGLKATAHAEDGLVEAVEIADGVFYLVAVQWHPEELIHIPEQKKLLQQFLAACRTRETTTETRK